MEFRGVKIGPRTLLLCALSALIGAYFSFNSDSFYGFVSLPVFMAFFFGLISFSINNFSPSKVLLVIVVLSFVSLVVLLYSSSFCHTDAIISYGVAENPINGKVVSERFIDSSGGSHCKEERFPWYYQEPNNSEIENYCDENPGKGYCVKNNLGDGNIVEYCRKNPEDYYCKKILRGLS